jgi:large subunit ribosomal protein L24
MSAKEEIKRGSQVIVITGSNKGKQGKVLEIKRKKNRVVIENVAMVKKHEKAKDKAEGGIIEREGSIHRSNVMLLEKFNLKKSK